LHVVQPDVGFVGGLHETLRIIHHAEASNIKTAIHCGASMGPSQAASWHIAAACKSVEWLEQVPAARKIQRDLMLDPFEMKDGFVGLPTEPGLGVRITEEHLRRYAFVPGTGERT
jgi:L-alanine-DL-glutamate epimerase-like enolase superfamily enzyme